MRSHFAHQNLTGGDSPRGPLHSLDSLRRYEKGYSPLPRSISLHES